MTRYDDEYDQEKKLAKKYAKLSVQELKEEYDRQLKNEFITQLANIQKTVSNLIADSINQIMLNAIGMERDRWNDHWKVDHCNGRRGAIVDEIGRHALAQVKLAIPDFVAALVTEEAGVKKTLSRELRAEYKEVFGRALREKLLEAAKERASKDVQAMAEKVLAENEEPEVKEPDGT